MTYNVLNDIIYYEIYLNNEGQELNQNKEITMKLGRHLIMDVITNNKEKLISSEIAEDYIYKVTELAKMQMVIPVINTSFPFSTELVGMMNKINITISNIDKKYLSNSKEENDTGVSAIGIWNTSHTASYPWTNEYYVSIDLFSCQDFDIDPIIEYTKQHYDAERIDILNVGRFIGQPQTVNQFTVFRGIKNDT